LPRELDRVLAVPDLHALVRAGAEVHLDGRRDFPVRCRWGGRVGQRGCSRGGGGLVAARVAEFGLIHSSSSVILELADGVP
jgi:hypothetical protein